MAQTFGRVDMGPGGYTKGLVTAPGSKVYARQDVAGLYRWDPKNARWKQLLDWVSPETADTAGACDGIGVDPNHPNVVYAALGKDGSAGYNGGNGLYRSNDGGDTWTRVFATTVVGHGTDNMVGEPLAVDPNASQVVYFGTRTVGLQRNTDGGVGSWNRVNGVPSGDTANRVGVRIVAIDKSLTTLVGGQRRSALVYVGVPGIGIYRSSDGGQTFALLRGAGSPAALASTHRIGIQTGRCAVFATDGGLFRYDDHTSAWTDITPSGYTGKPFGAIAVSPANDGYLVCAINGGPGSPLFRSTDNGKTWVELDPRKPATVTVQSIGAGGIQNVAAGISSLVFDTGNAKALWFSDTYNVYRTANIWAALPVAFTDVPNGLENQVVKSMLPTDPATTNGTALLYSVEDNIGGRFTDIKQPPTVLPYQWGPNWVDIVQCPSQPLVLYASAPLNWSFTYQGYVILSNDGGKTWAARNSPFGANTDVGTARLAVSARYPDEVLYLAQLKSPSVSWNGGWNWNTTNAPNGALQPPFGSPTGMGDIYNYNWPLDADRVNGNVFYLYNGADARLYVSTNGGSVWKATFALPAKPNDYFQPVNIAAAPGKEGTVWVSLGTNGLWKSSDQGASFHQVGGSGSSQVVQNSHLFCWGKARVGGNPTAFLYGKVNGQWGVWRSTDLGTSWTRINIDAFQIPGAGVMRGDPAIYGRVYIGTSTGIAYIDSASL